MNTAAISNRNVIWKFPLNANLETNIAEVEMPAQAAIFSCQLQNGTPTLWAMCNPEAPKEKRAYRLIMTGEEFDATKPMMYGGTVQRQDGIVLHVFEVISEERMRAMMAAQGMQVEPLAEGEIPAEEGDACDCGDADCEE